MDIIEVDRRVKTCNMWACHRAVILSEPAVFPKAARLDRQYLYLDIRESSVINIAL